MSSTIDLQEHRRKVFFEGLSSETTTNSLIAYLSTEYQLEACVVPKEQGINERHGFAIFSDERSVDDLMDERPHRIDDKEVEIYRSVPNQGRLIEKKGVKNLIVSQIKDNLNTTDLKHYFRKYGPIHSIQMNDDENLCRIEFDDYDSVDKALLHESHIIHQVQVSLKKGDRNYQLRANASVCDRQIKHRDGIPKALDISEPTKLYCIHITNLPPKIDAESLSKEFNWPIYHLLMRPVAEERSLPTVCWLKSVNSEQIADDFVKEWDGKIIFGYRIKCYYEEDTKELCKYFRFGKCHQKDVCQWEHIMCPANKACSFLDCPYGHDIGVRTTRIPDEPTGKYRIKITGFQTKLTPLILAQLLDYTNERQCYIRYSEDYIGYIVKLNTIKYAKGLIERWHNKEIEDGQILKCQLELNIVPLGFKTWSNFPLVPNRQNEDDDSHHCSASCQQHDYTMERSRVSSASIDDGFFDNKFVDQRDCDSNRKESPASSIDSKLQLPIDLKDDWEQTKEAEGNGEKVLLIREKMDRKHLAVIKIYNDNDIISYNNELKAIQILKNINNVSQLIECSLDKDNTWILMERAPGYSLKEFINRKYHGDINVLEAIKFVQKLLLLLKEVHSQNIVYRNLEPENIMIEWDWKNSSIEHACLTLINFSQAYIKSDIIDPVDQQSKQRWYQAPQETVEGFKYSSTIDTSGICAILLWLLTNINPRHNHDKLPHQQDECRDKLEKKMNQTVETINLKRNNPMKVDQLKTYLTDTFNMAFGYPDYQPWTIEDLECRLESVCEILSPTYPMLNTTERIFEELLSTANTIPSTAIDVYQDIFEKASNAFCEAKKHFVGSSDDNRYSWSDGACTWMNTAQTEMNKRQHDDKLIFNSRNRGIPSSCSIMISCLATVGNRSSGNIVTLSIGSLVNGQMNRIPIGQYRKSQKYTAEFKDNFIVELKNLIISICKQRKAIH